MFSNFVVCSGNAGVRFKTDMGVGFPHYFLPATVFVTAVEEIKTWREMIFLSQATHTLLAFWNLKNSKHNLH